jgi:hypothetical protein
MNASEYMFVLLARERLIDSNILLDTNGPIQEKNHSNVPNVAEGLQGGKPLIADRGTMLITSDLLLRHRQKIHDRGKPSKQSRRPRSQSTSVLLERSPANTKLDPPLRQKSRRESISIAPIPPQDPSIQGTQPSNTAIYMPASAPAIKTSFFNFNYPSPLSTSPSCTGTDLMDCSRCINYVNPADIFSASSFTAPQNFATPASTSSNSSIIPPTPPFSTYMPSFTGSSNINPMHRTSISSSIFDISTMMNTLPDQNSQCPAEPDENTLMMDTELNFSPGQLLDMNSPASLTNDSGFPTTHSSTPYQFEWQATSRSSGSDEYNTTLPFEPSASSFSPMDIVMNDNYKLPSNPFTPEAQHPARLFAAFPDSNDVFDLLIDDREPSGSIRQEIVDSMLRGNLITAAQNAGVSVPEIPVEVDLSIYVSAYWQYIHPHFPIFFRPGFVAHFVQEGVLFGMCALGALTAGAMQHAVSLNICTKAVVKDVYCSIILLILATNSRILWFSRRSRVAVG